MSVLGRNQDQVVVGVDGSPPSLAALSWARHEALLRGTSLEVVTAWPVPPRGGRPAIVDVTEARALGEASIRATTPAGRRNNPPTKVWVSPVPTTPEDLLLRRAHHAQLLVVGPHSHHTLREHLLGGVTEYVLAQAKCPVVVVRLAPDPRPRDCIVVGIDGTPASYAALRWAVHEAELSDAKVAAMTVWDWRPEYGVYPYGPDERQQAARAESILARAVASLAEADRHRVQSEVVRGTAADVLIDASRDADLLVVGNNRPGHAASHMLGSVSRKVASHAGVPVVVAHGVTTGDSQPGGSAS